MPYGNFYYGKGGFQYKKMSGGGGRRNFAVELMDNQPHSIYNSYVPGAGVGATSIASRRAKLIRATKCSSGYKCGRFYTYLGIKPLQSNTILDIISEKLQQKQGNIVKNNGNLLTQQGVGTGTGTGLTPQDWRTELQLGGGGFTLVDSTLGGSTLGGSTLGGSQMHQNLGGSHYKESSDVNINNYQSSTGSAHAGGGT
jgi:hypothetical protein